MSDPNPRNPSVFQEEDRVNGRKALSLIIAVLVVVVGCIIIAWAVLRSDEPAGAHIDWRPARVDETVGPTEIQGIRQTLIDEDTSTAELAAAQRRQVDSYGWVDRSAGVVHIPVERAMQILIARGSAASLPGAATDTPSAAPGTGTGGAGAPAQTGEPRDTTGGRTR